VAGVNISQVKSIEYVGKFMINSIIVMGRMIGCIHIRALLAIMSGIARAHKKFFLTRQILRTDRYNDNEDRQSPERSPIPRNTHQMSPKALEIL
jgi:hypothetical protein